MGYLKRMQKILRKPETIVLLAWVITVGFFLVSGRLVAALGAVTRPERTALLSGVTTSIYQVSWLIVVATFPTVLALGLALKPRDLALALALAWPSVLVCFGALFVLVFQAKWYDTRPVAWSMLFLLYMAIYVPVLMRAAKDEEKRRRLYRAALLVMALVTVTALLGFTLFRSG